MKKQINIAMFIFAAISNLFGQSANSWEHIGPEHNAMLDKVQNAPKFPNLTTTEIYNLAKEGVQRRGEYVMPEAEAVQAARFASQTAKIERVAAHYRDRNVFSNALYTELKNLSDIVNSCNGNPELMNSRVRPFESGIMNSQRLTNDEKNIVLGACVIARSSTTYWDQITPESDWGVFLAANNGGGGEPKARKIWKILADVGGFIAGAGACAAAGLPYAAGSAGTLCANLASGLVD